MRVGQYEAGGLDAIRGRIANGVLIVLAVAALPSLVASLMRIQTIGWQPVFAIHVVLTIFLVVSALMRNKVSVLSRAIVVSGFFFIAGVVGVWSFGLGSASYSLIVISVVFATILNGLRGGLVLVFLGSLAIMVLGAAYATGHIQQEIDLNEYNAQGQTWVLAAVVFVLLSGSAMAAVLGLNKALIKSVQDLQNHKDNLEAEIHDRTQELRLLHQTTLEAVEAENVDDLMRHILRVICTEMSWPVGHVYVLDDDGKDRLVSSKVWHLDDPERFADFRDVSEQFVFGPGEGLPGKALIQKEPLWISDVMATSEFLRAKQARDIGVRAGLAFRVISSDRVWGVMEFFSGNPEEPNPQMIKNLTYIGGEIGRAIEKKAVQEELKFTQERFDLAVRGSGDALWEYDSRTEVNWFSPRLIEMLGYEPGEIPHTLDTWKEHMHPDDAESAYQAFLAHLASDVPYDIEYRMRSKDGSIGWYRARAKSLRNDGGVAYRTSGSVTDITARKEAELALFESERRVSALIDNSPSELIIKDRDYRYVLINRGFEEHYGVTRDQVIGKRSEDFLHESMVGPIHEQDRAVLEEGKASEIELETVVDGKKRTFLENKFPIYDADGEVMGIGGIATDITERKKYEAKLANAEADLRNLLDASPVAITISNSKGEFVYANEKAFELSGTQYDSLLGTSAKDQYAQLVDMDRITELLATERRVKELEVELYKGDGGTFWCLMSIEPIHYQGGNCFITWAVNITRRKLAEAAASLAEEEIAQKEKELRTAMESMSDALFMLDENGRFSLYNENYVKMADVPEGTIKIGASIEEVLHHYAARGDYGDGDLEKIVQERRLKLTGEGYSELDMALKNGNFLHSRKAPIEGGGSVVVLSDVTTQKKAELSLQHERQNFSHVLGNVAQGIVKWGADERLVSWNKQYQDLLDLPDQLMTVGRPLQEVTLFVARRGDYGEGDPEQLAQERIRYLMQGKATRNELTVGNDHTYDVLVQPVDDGGVIITYTDISERKKSEKIIADAMGLIQESIQYASRIQRSILPTQKQMNDYFAESFAIWEPKDVVGGDVYLLRKSASGLLLLVADCTGHGVPGAFMTMIVTGALDQAIIENPAGDPASLLTRINALVKITLGQHGTESGESDDGLECGLCFIDSGKKEFTYAGARFELWSIKSGALEVIKGDRIGLGYRRTPEDRTFTNHTMGYDEKSAYYLFSDGMIDQIGGSKKRGFGKKRLKSILMDYSLMPMNQQPAQILRDFEEFQHAEERRDDVTLIAFKLL